MSETKTWRSRAARHWAKACAAADTELAYVNLLIAADCHASAIEVDAAGGPMPAAGSEHGSDERTSGCGQ
ncbi:MAG: hypothetical protein L6R19_16665 [Alphaproteobacteria bacterium]|nr:hypothetical protein [Alphaproteobacteria bacterium]